MKKNSKNLLEHFFFGGQKVNFLVFRSAPMSNHLLFQNFVLRLFFQFPTIRNPKKILALAHFRGRFLGLKSADSADFSSF